MEESGGFGAQVLASVSGDGDPFALPGTARGGRPVGLVSAVSQLPSA